MADELEYLQPGFDPSTLTVPRLRSLLVEYDVAWPSSAKKPQLIELFNEHIAPKARKILGARTRTQRTSFGISDAASVEYDDDDREPTPQPRRSGRQSRAATEESMVSAAPSIGSRASRASRASRQSTARLSEAPESEYERATPARSTSRRSKKSVSTPAVVKEEPDTESPFTQDNPFQSGSSPQVESTADSRRRTTGFLSEKKDRASSGRRKTETPPAASIPRSRRSAAFEVPLHKEESEDSSVDEVDEIAGEEFTLEEAELLKQEEEAQGKQLLPTRRTSTRPAGGAWKLAPLAIIAAIGGGIFTKWREEKIAVGYCGIGRASTSIAGIEFPEWAEFLLPQCEPCPPHAYCHADLQTTCETDFILHPHPLSLGGLVPLPPSCEPDSEKARRVQNVANRAVEELRERNAQYECGELKDEDGKRIKSPEVVEEEIKTVVASKRKKGMSQSEFEDLWYSAIGEIQSREEVVAHTNGTHRILRSTSLARIPLSCAIRRSLRLTLAKYLRQLAIVIFTLGVAAYGYRSLLISRSTEARAKQLASFAFRRLSTQASLHAEGRVSEPYISVGQLRDDVLREEFSRSRRENLWKKVASKVENNSNIRPRVTETRTGEVTRVWEWIGAIERIEYSPANQIEERRPVY